MTDLKHLSSLWGYGHYNGLESTASFNFTDLVVKPVPNSIYNQQPRCAQSSAWLFCNICDATYSDDFCTRTLPYMPIIAIPMEVRELDPAWAFCTGGLRGAYDPPVALQGTTAEVLPTVPGVISTSTAQPASTPTPATATITSQTPKATTPLPTSNSDPTQGIQPTTSGVNPASTTVPVSSDQDPPVSTQSSSEHDSSGPDQTTTNPTQLSQSSPTQIDSTQTEPSQTDPAKSTPTQTTPAQTDTAQTDPAETDAASSGNYGTTNALTIPSQADSGQTDPAEPTPTQTNSAQSEPAQTEPAMTSAASSGDPGTTNALTILSQAESASNPATLPENSVPVGVPVSTHTATSPAPVSSFDPAASSSQTQDPNSVQSTILGYTNAGSNTAPLQTLTANGQPLTVSQGSGSVAIAQGGSTVLVANGASTTFLGHVYSVGSTGGDVVIDTTDSQAIGGAAQSPTAAVLTIGGQSVTAIQGGGSVAIAQGGTTVMVNNGASTTLLGHEYSVGSTGGDIVVDKTVLQVVPNAASSPMAAMLTVDGVSVVEVQSAGSVVLAQGGSSVTVAKGSSISFGGHEFSIDPSVNTVVVDNTDAQALPIATQPPAAIFTATNGDIITAQRQDGNVVLNGADSATTLLGQSGIFEGQTVNLQASGSLLVIGSQTVNLPGTTFDGNSGPTSGLGPQQVWTEGGTKFTAAQEGSSIVVVGGSSTLTLADGAETTFAGQTLSAATGSLDGALVVDATSTLRFASEQGAATLTENGQTIAASAVSGAVVLVEYGSSITVANGVVTTLPQGQVVSVPTSGGLVVVDGSKTMSLGSVASSSMATGSSDPGAQASATIGAPKDTVNGGSKMGYSNVIVLLLLLVLAMSI
ncbi:hypothetical protein LTR08_006851 [Meristemomyces frigidus]|nr:hypothetical protein LTR08_006851 [Meristemomyces frigidus]